jgi:hypothetical protein
VPPWQRLPDQSAAGACGPAALPDQAVSDHAVRAEPVCAEREGRCPQPPRPCVWLYIARSGVTVTRLLCDPLPDKNVLKVPHTGKSGRHLPLSLSVQNVPQNVAHFFFFRVRYSIRAMAEERKEWKAKLSPIAPIQAFCGTHSSDGRVFMSACQGVRAAT